MIGWLKEGEYLIRPIKNMNVLDDEFVYIKKDQIDLSQQGYLT